MPKHSNPVIQQTLRLKTEFGQRVYRRGFERAARSLFALDVVLRLVARPDEADAVEKLINDMIQQWLDDLAQERERLRALMEANGVTGELVYTAPMETTVAISSPQVARLVAMLEQFDALVVDIDKLWMAQVIDSRRRSRLIHDWQRRTLRLGNRIVEIERRAHRAAREKTNGEAHEDQNGPGATNADAAPEPGGVTEDSGQAASRSEAEAEAEAEVRA